MTLYAQFQQRLYLYVLALLANPADAEDVFQEINLVLWRKFGEFEPGTNFFAWACQIARYKVLQYRQQQARDAMVLDLQVLEQLSAEASEASEQLELQRAALAKCLGQLRPHDRQLIELRYAPGATGRSVAEALGRPANSVYLSLSRIRRALLACVSRRLAADERGGR